jgi:hypothetical protein
MILCARETRMHKPLHLSDKRKQLYSYFVKTSLFVILLATSALGGDVTGDFSTSNENSTVDSNNVSNTYNGAGSSPGSQPVMSAIAPTVMGGGGNDSCLIPKSNGISLSLIGISNGYMEQDDHCNRRKNARLLGAPQQVGGLGLQVSAISVLCQDPQVFRSMMLANTPCPINDATTGKLLMGKKAIAKYRKNPEVYIVGYELDKEFWDALLKVEEEDYEILQALEDDTPKLSISDRFRTSKRRNTDASRLRDDGAGEDKLSDK